MNFKRRRFIINPKFQFRFAFYICTWILALSAIFPLLLDQSFSLLAEHVVSLPGGPDIQQVLVAKRQLLLWVYVLEVAFAGAVFALSIFLSHRIAGPLYKLNEYFKEAAATGRLKPDLKFREHDHFKELAESYNAMVTAVSKKQSS